jgi:hypothetical protein
VSEDKAGGRLYCRWYTIVAHSTVTVHGRRENRPTIAGLIEIEVSNLRFRLLASNAAFAHQSDGRRSITAVEMGDDVGGVD